MTQLIFSTMDLEYFEILKGSELLSGGKKVERKRVKAKILLEALTKIALDQNVESEVIVKEHNILTEYRNVIDIIETNYRTIYVYNLEEREIRTFYNNKPYKLVHPKSIVTLEVQNGRAGSLYIHPYKEFEGMNTVLYENPFPNVTVPSNLVCVGSIDRTYKGLEKTILGIIEGTYTHANTNFKGKDLKKTEDAFKAMEEVFPYDKLKVKKKNLSQTIDEIKRECERR